MLKSIALILVALALVGCASADLSSYKRLPENSFAWDGLGPDPSDTAQPRRTIATKRASHVASSIASVRHDPPALAVLPKYSKEWVARYAAMQATDDARLAHAIVICRGC